jgi:hypothetical protein
VIEVHRCSVDGCPNRAAYEVLHYDFDPAEGAVVFREDRTCAYICVEHAIENERRCTASVHDGHTIGAYPYTNAERASGRSIYRPVETL